jgi:hypothetical protein
VSALPNGSASATDRTLTCPAWLALPHVERTSEDASKGTQIHRFIRDALEGVDPKRALERVDPAYRATCVLIDWRALGGDLTDIECESAYLIDVRARSARLLGFDVGRQYAKAAGGKIGPWEMPGSLDIGGRRRDRPRTFVVLDCKTGFREVTPADRNGQGLFFAAAILLSRDDIDEVEFRIARVKTSGDVWDRDRFTFTRLDVDMFLDDLEEAIGRAREAKKLVLAGGTPDVATGHCTYCPAFDACPAQHALARSMLGDLKDIQGRVEAMSHEQLGAAFELANERIKPLLARVLDPIKDRIKREGEVPAMTEGKAVRPISFPREDFSGEAARALLAQLGATPAQIASCYRSHEITQVKLVNATKRKVRAA